MPRPRAAGATGSKPNSPARFATWPDASERAQAFGGDRGPIRSHYTPRELTEPIVRTALAPIFARRQVAQRCLYGVDRNPKAVDLAKLSLWLVTLAKDHPLTFLDHALRPGDALVGLSRRQLDAFHWKDDANPFQAGFEAMRAREHLARASELRRRIREADDSVSELELRHLCDDARDETDNVRLLGDLALAAFFEWSKPKQREDLRRQLADAVQRGGMHRYQGWIEELRRKEPPAIRTGSSRCTRRATATPIWSPTSSAAPSGCCVRAARPA